MPLPLPPPAPTPSELCLQVGSRRLPLRLVRHRRARRYVLRLERDGSAARVTLPRGGTVADAWRFAQRNLLWLEEQLLKRASRVNRPRSWQAGTQLLLRGEPVRLELHADAGLAARVRLGDHLVPVPDPQGDWRPELEAYLWHLAKKELPGRVFELARLHQFDVRRVTVRNQRSRWGSCSRRGTISLNWRLLQAPASICDYLILHELAHLRAMNHSPRFWEEVARLCPRWQEAEHWLKHHAELLARP